MCHCQYCNCHFGMNYHHTRPKHDGPILHAQQSTTVKRGARIFLFSKAKGIGLATSSPQTQAQQHTNFPTSTDKRSNIRSHTCCKWTINHRANAKMWWSKLHWFGRWDCIAKIWKRKTQCWMYMQNLCELIKRSGMVVQSFQCREVMN